MQIDIETANEMTPAIPLALQYGY